MKEPSKLLTFLIGVILALILALISVQVNMNSHSKIQASDLDKIKITREISEFRQARDIRHYQKAKPVNLDKHIKITDIIRIDG